MTDGGRPQDQGRRHRKRGAPTAETATLLAEYQASMRDELRAVLAELRGHLPDPGLGLVDELTQPVRPSLAERMKLWTLAIQVARELGTEVDPAGGPEDGGKLIPLARGRRRAKVDYGPD